MYVFVQFLSYNKFVTCAIFSKNGKKVYIIEHDRPRCHNVVADLVCFSNDYRIIPVD